MIDVRDELHTLDEAQLQQLRDRSKAYGFDIKVLVSDGAGSKADLEQLVRARVTGTNQVSLGIDPRHHYTYVRGSRDLALPSGPEVASAGNAFFKKGDLVGGIDAIAARTNSLKASRVVESQTGVPIVVHEHTTSAGAWWLLGGLAAVVLIVVIWTILRTKKRDAEARRINAELNNEIADRQLERAERGAVSDFDRRLRATQEPPEAWPPPPSARPHHATPAPAPATPQPATIVVNQGGSRDGLTDLLLFDAITRDRQNDHHHETVVHERVVERSSGDSGSSSSSSWGDSSGSSSDSSSSSDWGGDGGGFDSGGGGSDW